MCLLIVLHRSHPDADLVVAANRDELLARPSEAMTVLNPGPPKILGGRDLVAKGTWLAVNEHGVIAGLTNLPSSQVARDPTKRSRGELPLVLACCSTAEQAVQAFQSSVRPADYNSAWMLVADRRSLFYVDLTGPDVLIEQLPPGDYVLENSSIHAGSPKQRMLRSALRGIAHSRGADLLTRLQEVLASHQAPVQSPEPAESSGRRLRAACVHSDNFGTRSSLIAIVPPAAGFPRVWFADGPPCSAPLQEATELWKQNARCD